MADGEAPPPVAQDFVPTKEWLSKVLKVPVTDCIAEQRVGGVDAGMSGAKYFNCNVAYAGPQLDPTFGLPKELFVKVRSPDQPADEFKPETVVANLARHMFDAPPMARIFHADPNTIVAENLKSDLSTKLWKNCGDDHNNVSVKDATQILAAYAHLHADFWKLPHVDGLLTWKTWGPAFTGGEEWTEEVRDTAFSVFGEHRVMFEKMRDEIGFEKIFEYLSSFGTTLCQGDAHNGQVLKIKKHSAYAEEHGRWQLIDFGNAIIAHPAIDVGSFILGVEITSDDDWNQCLNAYLEALKKRGVDPGMTFEQFELHVQICAFWRLLFVFCIMEAMGPMSEEVKNALRSQMNAEPPLGQRSYDFLVSEIEKQKAGVGGGGYP